MFAISPTDLNWFEFLKNEGFNTEINFWTPTPWNVSRMEAGDRLYFMLKSPIRKIGGYGQFLEYKNTTVNNAWNEFGLKNGCASKKEFVGRLDKYKSNRSTDIRTVSESEIGCIVLTNTVYFDEDEYLDLNNYDIDFSKYIVKIKYFSSEDQLKRNEVLNELPNEFELLPATIDKLKKSRSVTERKGQGKFRAKISYAYRNKCCICGDNTPELLQAAHIQPYFNENSNHVKNGLLLRIDFHKLYDSGLMFIDESFKIHMSPQVESNYYGKFNGKFINLPSNVKLHPSREALMSKEFEYRNA